jgi:hypothetical protein
MRREYSIAFLFHLVRCILNVYIMMVIVPELNCSFGKHHQLDASRQHQEKVNVLLHGVNIPGLWSVTMVRVVRGRAFVFGEPR